MLERTLENLAPHLICEKLQILGGEPLLHPQIADILAVGARSRLARKLTVKTNGMLLHRVPVQFWCLADEVIVSVYPETKSILARRRAELERAAFEHSTDLVFRDICDFQEIAVVARPGSEEMTKEIYAHCEFKTFTHSVRNGRVYRCAPSVNVVRGQGDLEEHDSLDALDCVELRERLERFLLSPTPLRACSQCMGSSGAKFAHVMEHPRRAEIWLP